MKKKILIYLVAALVLIAVVLGILYGTKPKKEISSGAKLVFRGKCELMKNTEPADFFENEEGIHGY